MNELRTFVTPAVIAGLIGVVIVFTLLLSAYIHASAKADRLSTENERLRAELAAKEIVV